jgi:epoxyqueuosine reductase
MRDGSSLARRTAAENAWCRVSSHPLRLGSAGSQTRVANAPSARTQWVVERARSLGIDLCGVALAEAFPELEHLPLWLEKGYAGEMRYLHDPRRQSPALALAGARSVIVCALNYNTPLPSSTEALAADLSAGSGQPAEAGEPAGSAAGPRGWISRYAWGGDYHKILGTKLEALVAAMRAEFAAEPFDARAYVDTGPVIERVAAKYAGLGWLAKNTCLINEDLGSWLFLGIILTTLDLAPSLAPGDLPPADLCGNCRLCIDACPTAALVEPYVLDARRCISYFTIELRGAIPEEFRPAMERMVFGCDICQDVCPWNRKAPLTAPAEFLPRIAKKGNGKEKTEKDEPHAFVPSGAAPNSLYLPHLEWLVSLNEIEFKDIFRGSAIQRTKWRGLVRNACVALGNSWIARRSEVFPRIVERLETLAASDDALIAEHARWALARLSGPARVTFSSAKPS